MLELRREKGITQKQIARALNVSEQTVRNWEHGVYEPRFTVAQMKLLCKLFGRSLDELPNQLSPSNAIKAIE